MTYCKTKIYNPESFRCVDPNGKVGKRLLTMYTVEQLNALMAERETLLKATAEREKARERPPKPSESPKPSPKPSESPKPSPKPPMPPSQAATDKKVDEAIEETNTKIAEQLKALKPVVPPDVDKKEVKEAANKLKKEGDALVDRVRLVDRWLQKVPLYTRMIEAIMKSLVCAVMYSVFVVLNRGGPVFGRPYIGMWDLNMFAAAGMFVVVFLQVMLSEYFDVFSSFFASSRLSAVFSKIMERVPLLGRLFQLLQRVYQLWWEHGTYINLLISLVTFFMMSGVQVAALTPSMLFQGFRFGKVVFDLLSALFADTFKPMIESVTKYVAGTYMEPFVRTEMFSVIYLTLNSNYTSAAAQATALATGALSFFCGTTNLKCRSVSLAMSIPGAAVALKTSAQNLIKFSTVLTGSGSLESRICQACVLPKSFSYEEAEKRKQAEKDERRRRYEDEIRRAQNEANEKNEQMRRDKERRRQERERKRKDEESYERERRRHEEAERQRKESAKRWQEILKEQEEQMEEKIRQKKNEEYKKNLEDQRVENRQADLRVFGVNAESWEAMTRTEQQKWYRKLAMKYHPDKDKGVDDNIMRRINEAADRLLRR